MRVLPLRCARTLGSGGILLTCISALSLLSGMPDGGCIYAESALVPYLYTFNFLLTTNYGPIWTVPYLSVASIYEILPVHR
ncbi:hypothetical protein GGF50DRAFT_102909 [Schizophyllum commune]